MSKKLESLIHEFTKAFEVKIANFESPCPKDTHPEKWDRSLQKFKRRSKRFSELLEHIPPSLELAFQILNPEHPDTSRSLRESFYRDIRPRFIRTLIVQEEWQENLRTMGLTDNDIKKASRFGTLSKKGVCDATLDHIIPLSMGGRNTERNLVVVPYYINFLRDQFLTMQQSAIPNATEFLTFIPRRSSNSKIPKVPIFPRGFRKHTEEESVVYERINELFGAPILESHFD